MSHIAHRYGTGEATVLGELPEKIFRDRYALKGSEGETKELYVEQMWERVATAISRVEATHELREEWGQRFYNLLSGFKFIPGGRILAGAGSGHEVTFYNCFVLPSPEDSRHGIFESLKEWADIQARGGGVGINLSTLRPRGSYIKSVNGTSSGPVSWAELYSVTTGDVIQQGGSRRGAAMIMLDDDHPDIMEFIGAKRIDPRTNKPVTIEHANVSVAVSDAFMRAVKHDIEWTTQFPTRANRQVGDLFMLGKTYRAREIWEAICERAWTTAEPGMIFIDRANRESNSYYYLNARATNPCGEILLAPYHVCNLGALNLSTYVRGDMGYPEFDFDDLARDAKVAMRFLDNVVDASPYFIAENEAAQKGTRRTGLGTMGLADALIKLQVRYGSPESLKVIEDIYRTIRDAAYEASADLADEKGIAWEFDRDKYLAAPFIQRLPERLREKIAQQGMRNISLLCVAPTGTTSLLSGVSSGVEPVFAFKMQRVDRTGTHILDHPLLAAWKEGHPDQDIPDWFVDTSQLTPDEHVHVQATVQRYIDQQISKTVNAPNDHAVESVQKLYMDAYDLGCKGVTYYRDGSRDAVLTHIKENDAHGTDALPVLPAGLPADHAATGKIAGRPRPRRLPGYTSTIEAPEGNTHVTITSDPDGPFEIFVNVGRAGSDVAALAEALGRLCSLVLRVDPRLTPHQRLDEIANQLLGIGGSRSVGFGPNRVQSLPDAVGRLLAEHLDYDEGTGPVERDEVPLSPVRVASSGNYCPECGSTLVREEGCEKCFQCGFSKC